MTTFSGPSETVDIISNLDLQTDVNLIHRLVDGFGTTLVRDFFSYC